MAIGHTMDHFQDLPVVKKIKEIIGKWWKIQIHFTDPKGYLRGVKSGQFFTPLQKTCSLIVKNDRTFQKCLKCARQSSKNKTEILEKNCHAGFTTLSIPLIANGKFHGSIFVDGFLMSETELQQKQVIENFLKDEFHLSHDKIQTHLEELPVLNQKDVKYLKELIQVVIDEIIDLQEKIEKQEEKITKIHSNMRPQWNFKDIIGHSQAMKNIFHLLTRVSESDATILITGENGSGKEGIARAIHENSTRKKNKFVVQNCGAINDNLLESELFGHIKGAFTNAIKDKTGLFELADKGTLFLDEIGDTSPAMQVKLLRVLQEGSFIPVGSSDEKKVDVRILAATNKDLEKMVQEGSFREDLYYRLNVINIKVPPLRERREDIPLLIDGFLLDFSKEYKKKKKRIQPKCVSLMEKYHWPGNVRELKNEVERLCVLSGAAHEITENMLSEKISKLTNMVTVSHHDQKDFQLPHGTLKEALDDVEKLMIDKALQDHNGNKTKAAQQLGMSRVTIIQKCEKYGLKKSDYKKTAQKLETS